MRRQRVLAIVAVVCLASLLATGCVRRTVTITTEPEQALVFLNNQEVGRSTVQTDFLWYGDYEVTIRSEGYDTLKTNWKISPPWYQRVPFDFFAEVLWPGWLHDEHQAHFVLTPTTLPDADELIDRADQLRDEMDPLRE